MRVLADENFPRPALHALREAGWDVFSVQEECPGISDEDVIAVAAREGRILLTLDKDFGELVYRRGLPAASGVILFRITPESPQDAAAFALAVARSQPDLRSCFCVVTRERIRIRPLRSGPAL